MLVWLAILGAVEQPTGGADLEKSRHSLILLYKSRMFLNGDDNRRSLAC
jgi:hypothetical protein